MLRGRQLTLVPDLIEGHQPIGVDRQSLEVRIDPFLNISRQRIDGDKTTGISLRAEDDETRKARESTSVAIDPRRSPTRGDLVRTIRIGDNREVQRSFWRYQILENRGTNKIRTFADQTGSINGSDPIEIGRTRGFKRIDKCRLTRTYQEHRIAIGRHEFVDAIRFA